MRIASLPADSGSRRTKNEIPDQKFLSVDLFMFEVSQNASSTVDMLNQSSVLAITPYEIPDLTLLQVLCRLRVPTAIDLGRDQAQWPRLLTALDTLGGQSYLGLRVPDAVRLDGLELPPTVRFVITAPDTILPADWRQVPLIAQVCSIADVDAALALGVEGMIAKGQESGGLSGAESSYVLLQRVREHLQRKAEGHDLPVWCQGGIGLHTAAGVMAAGATGVVLDAVLGVYPESTLPAALKQRILAMDGSEVRTIAGYQVLPTHARDADHMMSWTAQAVQQALAQGSTLLPIGQDAALARGVLAQCSTIPVLLNTLRMRMAGQLHQAKNLQVLAEHSPWAAAHGVRYPIAQGPMTRVSDTAEFSRAVVDAGGLPFTALSLMTADASRKLLDETQALVGDRPWGVGVLGFADPAILDPQLELVREFKPTALLLAGGRPSQARPFMAMGIATYLHVPSPGLLDLFLKEGATHFVFEGRECGGHVGPRYSFVLWEQAVSRLLAHEQPEALHVLFAGGVHDDVSAAMVAAIVAPLAARGIKVGVLMGTAYIATEEAVSAGAVLADFQTRALSGETTVLVETAPGHAIRCIPSGFVELFDGEKARLHNEGVEQKVAWHQLEQLTVGRLRIATKGVDRVDGALVEISREVREQEGMYMIGQVIALKDQVTTVAALHDLVSRGSVAYLDHVLLPSFPADTQAEPVAIVGMACLYPGSPDVESFWENILAGRDLVTEVPADRWSVAQYYDQGNPARDKSVSKWGGFIPETPFDPLKYGIPPASLAAIEPVQLLALEVTVQALADAGYSERWFDRERTSVIFGAEAGMDLSSQYTFRNLWQQYAGDLPPALAEALPTLTEDSFPGMLVNVVSGRIANRLGLGGVNYAVTSACASSLTAVELGVKELRAQTSSMVLAGGADFHNGIHDYLMFSSVGALSAKGRCRSFDHEADGITLGEGVGVVVLKRLSDAERDGDRIYAVISGIAGSSDGKGLGLTAPRKEGQKRALERAYWQAGILPAEVGLVEAHGTGTVVGDRTELQTLSEVFVAGGAVPGQTGLGSVKSQIGHTKCAAGIAGLIKVAKALHHRVMPGTQMVTKPNDGYRAGVSPFQLNVDARPWWMAGAAHGAISAFGFGGANFHTVLSAWTPHQAAHGAVQFPVELMLVRGADIGEAKLTLQRVARLLAESNAPLNLRDIAYTVTQTGQGQVQIALVSQDLGQLQTQIEMILRGVEPSRTSGIRLRAADAVQGKVAFLFPGQGSQYVGMLQELLTYFPALHAGLPVASQAYWPVIYPETVYDDAARTAQSEALMDTRQAQPTLGLVEAALFDWLSGFGLRPDMAAGHSYGELVALATAGGMSREALLTLSRARADAMMADLGADAGMMAAVPKDALSLAELLRDWPEVVLANQNSPTQTVISGPSVAVEGALAALKAQGIAGKRIETAAAFHSPLMAPARERFAAALAAQDLTALTWPVYANTTARPHGEAIMIRHALAEHFTSPVRFVAEIEQMYADGARIFIEVGPRKVLTGLVGKILQAEPHRAIALDQQPGLAGLLVSLAEIAVLVDGFDARPLFEASAQGQRGHRASLIDLDQPQRLSATTWMVSGGHARPLKGKLPAHAAAIVHQPVVQIGPSGISPALPLATTSVSAGESALLGYLTNMRELVNAQRDVLLGYLGAPAASLQRTVAPPSHTLPAVTQTAHQAASSAPLVPAVDLQQILLELVSERTGYPAETLDLQLDLEADLSIDSIKRLEIIGELSQRLSLRAQLGAEADHALEQLSRQKTLQAVLDWLNQHLSASVETPSDVAEATSLASPSQVLLAVVSERTGYPAEMLDLQLDLEADLSIDSIKRLEIIGELAQRLELRQVLGADADALQEQLTRQKTLQAMLDWLEQHLPQSVAEPVTTQDVPTIFDSTHIAAILLSVVSECTGYPEEALDLDLDLEADLSIDSIKRLEIVGQLAQRLALVQGLARDALLEHLATCKTLRTMVTGVVSHSEAQVALSGSVQTETAADTAEEEIPFARYVLRQRLIPHTLASGLRFEGLRFLITQDGHGIAEQVARRLEDLGAHTKIVKFSPEIEQAAELTTIDGLIHLWSLHPDNQVEDVKRFFVAARTAVMSKARHLLVLTGLGGHFGLPNQDHRKGGGLAGMIKSVSREYDALRAHWLDVDPAEGNDVLAGYIEAELRAADIRPEVAWRQGQRYIRDVVHDRLSAEQLAGLPLDQHSVVLLTGGARGITALVAMELARRYQCQLELVGRSPLPAREESAVTLGILDPKQLRMALLNEDRSRKPAEIERMVQRTLAEREFRRTLAEVHAAGGRVNYTALDVRDADAFRDFIETIYVRHGRVDGVIHGAGVVEDKLIRDKTRDSFARVFDTKVNSALVLSQTIRDDVRLVVFFSSVASAFGNRGQVDYATANDMLDKLAHHWQGRIKGKVLSVNWGPWADTGMVSDSLKQEYARKGIGLIPKQQGVAALFDELASDAGEIQVVLMSGRPESFAATAPAVLEGI